ncbi:MAG: CBS domain-containing protein [Asgard group archaeon]|nr:CBS domain-containing protein [Asgard group archaeon]
MQDDSSSDSRILMEISDVMTSTVHTILPDQSVEEAAIMMLDYNVGCVVLIPNKNEKRPIGIVTERDIVTRVVAIGKNPAKIRVDEIATKPVVTVSPTLEISKAMSLMAKLNIRRVIVVEENTIVGIVTYRDLLRVAPSLLEIALEYERIGFGKQNEIDVMDFSVDDYDDEEDNPSGLSMGFYCSQCGQYCDDDPNYDDDDQPICGDCMNLNHNEQL